MSKKKGHPYRIIVPSFYDTDVGKENGDHTAQDDNVLAALDSFRSVYKEEDGGEHLMVSTRAKDEDGDWHTSIANIPLSNLEDGAEIHMTGSNGDMFKLVVSRALRFGLDPKTPVIPDEVPASLPVVSISAASQTPPSFEEKPTSSVVPFVVAAGLIGGAIMAALGEDERKIRIQCNDNIDALEEEPQVAMRGAE